MVVYVGHDSIGLRVDCSLALAAITEAEALSDMIRCVDVYTDGSYQQATDVIQGPTVCCLVQLRHFLTE
jgi:hypothetical protein